MAVIGFIGLGNMGSGMAANLVKAGHDVLAFDLSASAVQAAMTAGCRSADSAAAAARGANADITMLPAGRHVREIYQASLVDAAKPGALLIYCSTIDVASARAVAELADTKGLVAVDAPVSGGIAAAQGGTLTVMVGGSDKAFARAEPVLAAMGKAVIHAGPIGSGQAAKICNNMLLGVTMIATCEAFAMVQKLGLDAQMFYDISSKASGQSWSMTSYCPVAGVGPVTPADRDFQGGFATGLMLKDLKLAVEAAQLVDASVPMAAQAEALYQVFAGMGGAMKDFSAIITMLEGRLAH